MEFSLRRCAVSAGALLTLAACTSAPAGHRESLAPSSPTTSPAPTPTTSPSSSARTSAKPERSPTRAVPPVTTSNRPATTRPRPVATALPLAYSTGTATRVITVVAPSASSTTATLQAWDKAGHEWTRHGAAVAGYLASAGLTSQPSESLAATPIGSFTLTQAFGRNPNPGTSLPYTQTTPADWWISQSGPFYNTMQRCSGTCPFTQGEPNEHLYYTTPYYNYAVVIDINRAPVTQGAGSAFFLHVTVGAPTAGCISIAQSSLISLMKWLTPSARPRILIGVG